MRPWGEPWRWALSLPSSGKCELAVVRRKVLIGSETYFMANGWFDTSLVVSRAVQVL